MESLMDRVKFINEQHDIILYRCKQQLRIEEEILYKRFKENF